MIRISIISPKNCLTKYKSVKESLYKIKNSPKKASTIIMSTDNEGLEQQVKDMCIEMGLMYKESTSSSNERKEYSIIQNEKHYNKKYHFSQTLFKYDILVKNSDIVVFAVDDESKIDKFYIDILTKINNKNKKIIFI